MMALALVPVSFLPLLLQVPICLWEGSVWESSEAVAESLVELVEQHMVEPLVEVVLVGQHHWRLHCYPHSRSHSHS